ncbi:DNA-binding protein [Endozoicomonas sp.]|uniref:DNA-binding protein n=1 Tax=Endozoicomonas sp. TaxID=1892382 RepID=UPI003839DE1F
MKENDQDQQRRQRIFSILDGLKEKGERINADKVARIGKMGKQTILPYYNEWRFLGDLGEEQELELPDELVRSLKRGIARWKHQLTEEQRTFEESANQEIDQLKETLQQLLDKNERLNKSNEGLQSAQQKTQAELETTKLELQQKDQQHKELEALLQWEQKQNQQLQSMLEEQKALHQQSIINLEKQMDQRHQEQLDHWLRVVDDERRSKQGLEKNTAKLNEKLGELHKANLELQNRLDSKSKAYIQVCEERNQLSSGREKTEIILESTRKLMVLLDCEQEDVLKNVRSLQSESRESMIVHQQYQTTRSANDKLEIRLAESEDRVKQLSGLERELERVRGAAEAFEKALSVKPNKEEVKE